MDSLPLFPTANRQDGGIILLAKAKGPLLPPLFIWFAVESSLLFHSGAMTTDGHKKLACTSVHW